MREAVGLHSVIRVLESGAGDVAPRQVRQVGVRKQMNVFIVGLEDLVLWSLLPWPLYEQERRYWCVRILIMVNRCG